jgi:ABC-type amino acid transport system permease subunit
LSLVGGTIIGFFAGLGRTSRSRTLRYVLSIYGPLRGRFSLSSYHLFILLSRVYLGISCSGYSLTICTGLVCEIVKSGTRQRRAAEAAISTGLSRFQQLAHHRAARYHSSPLVGRMC